MSILRKVLKVLGLSILLIVVVIVAGYSFLRFDVMSYTATDSETLSPAGAPTGQALVVYDPGVSGGAKNAAVKIAGDLQSRGYRVELAGVRSPSAGNVSGYGTVVIVGPAYWDKLGSSAQSYLENLEVAHETRVGVFATGIVEPGSNDSAHMREFVTNLPAGSAVHVNAVAKLVTDFGGKDADQTAGHTDLMCGEFVAELAR